jgi:SPOR domain
LTIEPANAAAAAPAPTFEAPNSQPAASLADIAASIAALSDEEMKPAAGTQADETGTKPASEPLKLAQADPKPMTVEPKPDSKAAAAKNEDAVPAAASQAGRHWVQIASAPGTLVASEYRRLKKKHPKLLSDKEGHHAPMGKSNRVLVGPFASAGEAKAFVGDLKESGLTAVAWSSSDGQEIDKIPGK